MAWYSPPTRRELSLILFSLTVFILFYNLESSFSTDEWTSSQQGNKAVSAGNQTGAWDDVIYGNWTWEEQEVAENARKQASSDMASSAEPVVASFDPYFFGTVGINDGILEWDYDAPTTTVLEHAPGYTILDNLFMLNGTLFVVTDDPSFPPLGSIASSAEDPHANPRPVDWQILSSAQARETLGAFGGVIHGVSWLVTDATPSNYTLFSLWRTYSALDLGMSLDPDTLTLPPPRRIFYPNVPTFMGEQPDRAGPIVLRQRSPSGFHPYLVKAAFPTLGLMYKEDWEDYALLHVPYVIRRAVVADQGAARRARGDVPACTVPLLELAAAKGWWEPIRRNVARFVGVPEEAPKRGWLGKKETVVTYLSRQEAAGVRLNEVDHVALIKGLEGLGKGYRVQVVPARATWMERMRAIAQSTIVIGVYGDHMADSLYVPPSKDAAVIELFPPGVFVRDAALSIKSVNVRYVAWRKGRQYNIKALPPDAPPVEENMEVPVNVPALIKAIRRIA